jgi:hypothetical protein
LQRLGVLVDQQPGLLKRQPETEPPLVGALDMLQDPAFDTLLTGISHFNESSEVMQRLAFGDLPALCHVVT